MVYVIVGPTGIGKTKLSIAVAKHFNTEIISGDSVQVYKELNIGSAKVTAEEMDGITHHLIDILEPTDEFSVAVFQKLVRSKITEIQNKHKTPIIVGGTGLYIKSVLYDYNFQDTKRDTNEELKYSQYSNQELHQLLQSKDIVSSKKIHPNNRKRVLQAIHRSKTNKVSENNNKDKKVLDFKIIGLTLNREQLYEMINNRVDQMIDEGLIDEVKSLYDKKIRSNSVTAIGYKELYKYFDGLWSLEYSIEKIKQHSRNLAKKQFTFFSNQFDIKWIHVNINHFEETIHEAIKYFEQESD
jgi:tRNA dimethylallyltransferase